MPIVKLSVVCAPLLVASALLVSGCATTDADSTAGMSPNKLYAEAKDELSAGAFDKAAVLFEKLEGRAAGTPLAQQAQLEKAYARYKAGESAEALAALERFMKLHPASPALDI
jgi:outer membrane protein assembly factor BamD